MWDKPEHCKATGISRPVRVAYLVDLADCSHLLLDAIFAEAYSRWGGRRTAIVPATAEGLDERYAQWLFYLDPDIIYSFVDLSSAAVESIHERFAPAALIKHHVFGAEPGSSAAYRIALPIEALSSLTVVRTYLTRPGPFAPSADRLQVLDSHFKHSEHSFVEENFGIFSASFASNLTNRHADVFAPLTLISPEALADRHMAKNPSAIYVHAEHEVLAALAEHRRPLVMLANLSDMYAPYLSGHSHHVSEGLTVVVGDTPQDRLAFWNGIHRKDRMRPYEVAQLRIPRANFSDVAFIQALRKVVSTRGSYGSGNRNDAIALESSSIDREELDALAETLRRTDTWLSVLSRPLSDPVDVIPTFARDQSARFTTGSAFEEPEAKASSVFKGQRISVPIALPWHLEEAMPPASMRAGSWMVDLSIEREVDHSQFSNVRHIWVLPRRIRLERAFKFEIEGSRFWDRQQAHARPTRTGELAFAANLEQRSVELTLPEDDLTAIRIGIQNDYEWREFNQEVKGAPHSRLRFEWSALSDKGRYLLGVLQLFEDVPTAFSVLMSGFWREEIQRFGAGLVERRADLATRVGTTIRKRLGQRDGPLHLEGDAEIERLGEVALRVAAELRAEIPKRTYSEIEAHWREMTEEWLAANPQADSTAPIAEVESEDERYRDPRRYLDPSIQYLCERNVLFQGHEWQCRTCFNRNWIGITALSKEMVCDVCGTARAAFVSEEWHFRPNAFLIDAYRFHGTEPLVWALWRLYEAARNSFYFAPSVKLWNDYPRGDGLPWDAEIDAVAVAEGRVYAIEATRSKGLKEDELEKLALIAERIRPDVMMIACTAQTDTAIETLRTRLARRMPIGVEARVAVFRPEDLRRDPYVAP